MTRMKFKYVRIQGRELAKNTIEEVQPSWPPKDE